MDAGCSNSAPSGTSRRPMLLQLTHEPRTGSSQRSTVLERLFNTHAEIDRLEPFSSVRMAPVEPFTTLPQASYGASFERIVSDCGPDDLWPQSSTSLSVGTNAARRCVYRYADKYGFARLVMEGSLIFDSHFECGNLEAAFGVGPAGCSDYSVYELLLHPETDCGSGSVQWFCFSVRNAKPGKKVSFLIRNFSKPDSLFRTGMRPLIKSLKDESSTSAGVNCGWIRCGQNISYLMNGPDSSLPLSSGATHKRTSGEKSMTPTYTLQFTHTFERGQESAMFAYGYPYSYSDVQFLLRRMMKQHRISVPAHPPSSFVVRTAVLCSTNAGNQCHLLTITGRCESEEAMARRPVAIFTARVHPGETNASWIMHGLMQFFLGSSKAAVEVRNRFVIKIIPMLNPDGVVNGNNRKSLTGYDLNRVWASPDPALHPTIFHTKNLIAKLAKARHVCLCIDLHGHSRKEGIFVYGCVPDRSHLNSSMPPLASEVDAAASSAPSRSSGVAFSRASQTASRGDPSSNPLPEGSNETAVPRPPLAPQSRLMRPPPAALSAISYAPALTAPRENSFEVERPTDGGSRGRSRSLSGSTSISTGSCGKLEALGSGESRGRSASPTPCLFEGADSHPDPHRLLEFLNWKVRLFPRIMQSLIWCYDAKSTWYRMEASKASTMRMVMFTELGIECSYTVEASLAGAQGRHFSIEDLVCMGADLGRCLFVWKPLSSEANFKATLLKKLPDDDLDVDEIDKAADLFAAEVRSRYEDLGTELAGSMLWRHVELSKILSPAALFEILPLKSDSGRILGDSPSVSETAGPDSEEEDGEENEDVSDFEERTAAPAAPAAHSAPSSARHRSRSISTEKKRLVRPCGKSYGVAAVSSASGADPRRRDRKSIAVAAVALGEETPAAAASPPLLVPGVSPALPLPPASSATTPAPAPASLGPSARLRKLLPQYINDPKISMRSIDKPPYRRVSESRAASSSGGSNHIRVPGASSESGEQLCVRGSVFSGCVFEDPAIIADESAFSQTLPHENLPLSRLGALPGLACLGEDGMVIRGVKDLHWLHEQHKLFPIQSSSLHLSNNEAILLDAVPSDEGGACSNFAVVLDVATTSVDVESSSKPGPPNRSSGSSAAEGRASRTGLRVLKYSASSGY